MSPKKRSRRDNNQLNIISTNNDDPPLVILQPKPKWNWLFLENNGLTKNRRIRLYRGLESSSSTPAPAPEQSESDHIELNINVKKKNKTSRNKKEVSYTPKAISSSSMKKRKRVIKSKEQSENDHIELVCTNNTKNNKPKVIKAHEESERSQIVLACPNNTNKKKKPSTKKNKEVKYSPKGIMANTPGSPLSKSCIVASKQVFSSVKTRSCTNNKEMGKPSSTKKKKYKPKVIMANTPGSPASLNIGSKQVVSLSVKKKPSCRRALDFSTAGYYIKEKTMTIYTKGGFTLTRKVNNYNHLHQLHHLKILESNAKEEEKWWKNEHELFRQRALSFISCCRSVQGNRPFMGWKGSVVDSVVGVFLTQNVADNLSSSAFMSLASKFPNETVTGDLKNENHHTDHALDWNAVRCAQLQEVSDAIQERGMNYKLAERILNFLNCIHDNKSGLLDLEWLRNTEPAIATEYLMEVYGLGLKSTECLRLLTLRQKAFPVDRHVSRIVVRLGWVPIEKLPDGFLIHQLEEYPVIERVQEYLSHRLSTLDVETLYELHYQMITFGKVFCTKKKPNCESCPVKEDCKHYASKFGIEENTLVPVTPECSSKLEMEEDIEDMCLDPIRSVSKGREILTNTWNYMSEKNMSLNDVSQALITVSAEEASSSVRTLGFAKRLRTVHEVYELPDSHPLIEALDKRDRDDKHPYLLAIWPPGETLNPSIMEKEECRSLILSDSQEEEEEMVFGTFLIPCRTATRGSFPLDGTFFQINEVFADDESSRNPIVLPRKLVMNMNTKTLLCGTSITTIFKGMSRQKIQDCFWKGYVCIRGFCRKTREPRPLHQQFHPTLSKIVKINGAGKSPRRRKKDDENNKSN